MLTKLKRLFADTAVYGVSTILGRFLNFLLVPFYTNVLVPGEYGVVAYVYSLIAFVNVVYAYGMESAYFKYSSTLEVGTPQDNFSTPFISLVATSALFSGFLTLGASGVASLAGIPASGWVTCRHWPADGRRPRPGGPWPRCRAVCRTRRVGTTGTRGWK